MRGNPVEITEQRLTLQANILQHINVVFLFYVVFMLDLVRLSVPTDKCQDIGCCGKSRVTLT